MSMMKVTQHVHVVCYQIFRTAAYKCIIYHTERVIVSVKLNQNKKNVTNQD